MLYNKRWFFKDILIVVFVSHLVLLAILFLHDTSKFSQHKFVVNSNDTHSTIVFMPLKKRVEQPKNVGVGPANDGTRKVISYDEYEKKLKDKKPKKQKSAAKKKNGVKPKVTKPAAKPVVKKQSVAKVKPAKKSPTMLKVDNSKKIAADKKAAADKKKVAAKIAADKKKASLAKVVADKAKKEKAALVAKKATEKKLADKVAADKKNIEEKKKQEDELQQKKADEQVAFAKAAVDEAEKKNQELEAKQHQLELEKQAAIEKHEEELAAAQIASQEDESDEQDDESDIDLDNVTFVGSYDLESHQIGEQIKAEIVKYYKPPVGIAKNAVCGLKVLVGADRKAERVTVIKGSGSKANDICARTAALKMLYPKETIGTEITIELGQ